MMASNDRSQVNAIVAVCAFCGRWRDSLDQWHVPPTVVHPLVDLRIIDLTHTYCPACLRENTQTLGPHATEIADRKDAEAEAKIGQDHDPDDLVWNLITAYAGKELVTVPLGDTLYAQNGQFMSV